MNQTSDVPLPLAGVRVIENANVITGPFAGQMLGDLGADVIKVENPSGDQFRLWEGTTTSDVIPATFAAYNRGKRSISIDLKSAGGVETYRQLVSSADVVVENSRPGTMDRVGVGYESLRTDNPRLVYCSISGMGPTGPDAGRPTFDAVAQAASGLWSQLTDTAAPEPVGPPLADQLTGLYAVVGIVAALHRRQSTGAGSHVEVNMLASCLGFQPHSIANFEASGEVPDRLMRARVSQSYAFVDSDGRPFAIHLSTPQKFWAGLCDVIDRRELVDDERFATKTGRIDNYEVLRGVLQEVFGTRPRAAWLEELAAKDVPAAAILDLAEALSSPQVGAMGLLYRPPAGGSAAEHGLAHARLPVSFDGEFLSNTSPPPHLAEHTDEVLSAQGLTAEAIAALRESGSIG